MVAHGLLGLVGCLIQQAANRRDAAALSQQQQLQRSVEAQLAAQAPGGGATGGSAGAPAQAMKEQLESVRQRVQRQVLQLQQLTEAAAQQRGAVACCKGTNDVSRALRADTGAGRGAVSRAVI